MHNRNPHKAMANKAVDEIGAWITSLDDSPAELDEKTAWDQLEKEFRELHELKRR